MRTTLPKPQGFWARIVHPFRALERGGTIYETEKISEARLRSILRTGVVIGERKAMEQQGRVINYYNICRVCGAEETPVYFEETEYTACPNRHDEAHRTGALARLSASQPMEKLPVTPTPIPLVDRSQEPLPSWLQEHVPGQTPAKPFAPRAIFPEDAEIPPLGEQVQTSSMLLPHLPPVARREVYAELHTVPAILRLCPPPPEAAPVVKRKMSSVLEDLAAGQELSDGEAPTLQVPITVRNKILHREAKRLQTLAWASAEDDEEEAVCETAEG